MFSKPFVGSPETELLFQIVKQRAGASHANRLEHMPKADVRNRQTLKFGHGFFASLPNRRVRKMNR
jgi:hypothetical protein